MALDDTLTTVVAIGLSGVLMFGFPLMTMADRTDDISQLAVETSTTEYVDDVRTTGKLTLDKYLKYKEELAADNNTYSVEMEIKVLDENPGKKTSQAVSDKIGENVYYSEYTSQILDELETKGTKLLKEGDFFSASVKNTNSTMGQQLKNFFYMVSGNDTYTVAAQHGGIVTANGTGK